MNHPLLAAARGLLAEAKQAAMTDEPTHARRHANILRSAEASLAETAMLLQMAQGQEPTFHHSLAELHQHLLGCVQLVEHDLATNGLNLPGDADDTLVAFVSHQEDACRALEEARRTAAFTLMHMSRALESMRLAVQGAAVPASSTNS